MIFKLFFGKILGFLRNPKTLLYTGIFVVASSLVFGLYYYKSKTEKQNLIIENMNVELQTKEDRINFFKNSMSNLKEEIQNLRIMAENLNNLNKLNEKEKKDLTNRLKKYKFDLEVAKDRAAAAEFLNKTYNELLNCLEMASGRSNIECNTTKLNLDSQ